MVARRLQQRFHRRKTGLMVLIAWALAIGLAQSAGIPTGRDDVLASPAGIVKAPYEITVDLPSGNGGFSSPVLGDLDHEPTNDLEIVVGTEDGWIHAVRHDGTILWSYEARSALNAIAEVPTGATVRSAPCLADLDGDGWLEVIVGIGTVGSKGENGGVVALDHNGNLLPGWPVLTYSLSGAGVTAGVASSPAAGDLDNDGLLEIVFGGFDHRIYAYRLDGTPLEGWPYYNHDTVWSSPAIADLDNDGFDEVIIGSDAHDDSYWGFEDGGYIHVFDYQGKERSGFPKHIPQIIASSPGLADLDSDGYLDIVVGTGTFYGGASGYRVSAWNRDGNPLPGWPVLTGGAVPGSPAIGDIDGDGHLEVVVGAHDKKLWAWNHDGSVLWSRTPRDWTGSSRSLGSPILVDCDSDRKLETLINIGWEVAIVDDNGDQITWAGSEPNTSKYTYYTNYSINSTPAVADIDNDGRLELVAAGGYNGGASGRVYVWELDQSSTNDVADWPMFRKDATHSGRQQPIPAYDASVVGSTIPTIAPQGHSSSWQVTVRNTGTHSWSGSTWETWGLSGTNTDFTSETVLPLLPGETILPGDTKTFSFTVNTPSTPGFYTLSWRMFGPYAGLFGAKFSREIKVGQQPALYVLAKSENPDPNETIYPVGIAPSMGPIYTSYDFWMVAMDIRPDSRGYYLLDKYGFPDWGGNAPDFGGWGAVASQDLVIAPDGNGIYRLGSYGQIDQTVGLPVISSTPSFSSPKARSLAITRSGRGVYVLDAYGNVRRGGTAPLLSPAIPTWTDPIAKRIKLTANQTGYYVLDTYGRVHAGGSALAIEANYAPQIGEDWARDFDLAEDGLGYYMLDRYGGIHTGGTAVELTVNLPPTWSEDTAVDIELVDGRWLADPALNSSLSSMTFMLDDEGDGDWSRSFRLENTGSGGSLTWTASISPHVDWVDVTPDSGQTPGELTLNIATLPAEGVGRYDTELIIKAYLDAELADVVEVPVQLLVVAELYAVHLPLVLRQ